jgi:hypothetical protein
MRYFYFLHPTVIYKLYITENMADQNKKILITAYNIDCNTFWVPWPTSGNVKYKILGGSIATVVLGNNSETSLSH